MMKVRLHCWGVTPSLSDLLCLLVAIRKGMTVRPSRKVLNWPKHICRKDNSSACSSNNRLIRKLFPPEAILKVNFHAQQILILVTWHISRNVAQKLLYYNKTEWKSIKSKEYSYFNQ